jgi:hypothetical protein
LYTACRGNADSRLTYATTKKVATYRLENAREHLAAIERIARTIQRFLAVSPTRRNSSRSRLPTLDHFFVSDPSTRQAVFTHWGL